MPSLKLFGVSFILNCFVFFISFLVTLKTFGQNIGDYKSFKQSPHQILFTTSSGEQIRLKAYSDDVIRVQYVRKGESFFSDDHYEMVASHKMNGNFSIHDKGIFFEIHLAKPDVVIHVNKSPLRIEFLNQNQSLLKEGNGVSWKDNIISEDFTNDANEHFCGLGHQAYGLVPSIDLKGEETGVNYGDYDYRPKGNDYLPQASLIVPFFLSSKGYGLFLNSTFHNKFDFGKNNQFDFSINTSGFEGQMDYFFIMGPSFRTILDRYTQLTGRPRLPQLSIFGLHLSDKDTPDNEGEQWWKKEITAHRNAGFPLDHIVNDNRWRAGTGAWSGSWFEWDKNRYPNPAEYAVWAKQNGLTMTLDHNRNNGSLCWGWNPSYNIPHSERVKESNAVPDYSSKQVRNWIWSLFWNKSFNPALKYPGDGLWMDEIDELLNIDDTVKLADGRSWAEDKNYYPFLVAKAVVQEGWDNENKNQPPGIGESKRPYMWGRGSTAGAQRYAIHWTGDIMPDYDWMKKTIRGMQASGLSAFPYFNHDAGAYRHPGPDDTMYIQWSMAFGSFSPIWRPHGESGSPRWPLHRSKICQDAALKYGRIRYELMPYIYTNAYEAYVHGTPMARAMVVDYQQYPEAWKYDLQYMWGDDMLVAPQTTWKDSTYGIWFPQGQNWYSFWNDSLIKGGQVLSYRAKVGELPVFVKAGAIIPKFHYAKSTAWLNHEELIVEIYQGSNGQFVLYEDDGVSERYRTRNENRKTEIYYDDKNKTISIAAAKGSYLNAPAMRSYKVVVHNCNGSKSVLINGKTMVLSNCPDANLKNNSACYDKNKMQLSVQTSKFPVTQNVIVKF